MKEIQQFIIVIELLQAKIKSNNFTHSQFRWYVFEVAKRNAPRK